jgi:hypothetical protein
MPPPVSLLNADLGSLLIATWIDAMLLMLEITQVIHYFRNFPNDRLAKKLLVLFLLTMDILSEASHNLELYMYTIVNWGVESYLQNQHWPVAMFLPTTGIVALTVQGYLIRRLWLLRPSLWLALPFLALSLASCAGIMATAIISTLHPSLKDRHMAVISSIVWLGCGSAADTAIASALVWQLSTMKSPFMQTRSLMKRLIAYAISTGAAPATLALLSLITFLTDQDTNVCVAIGFCLGRTYTLTLLYNLNLRSSSRSASNRTMSTSLPGSAQRYPPEDTIDLAGINFIRTVHIDDAEIMPNGTSKFRANRSSRAQLDDHLLTDTKDAVSGSYITSAA